ncbi:MAG: hypothetical protein IKU60_01420 [Clostridia bacterium]|nr:hypothetical protein [Clostridia bacterium]
MNCTFFGHKDTSFLIYEKLQDTIEFLIKEKDVTHFYIGNHGNFDAMALRCLINLKEKHPYITFEIVLAYLPEKPTPYPTLYPEGIEKTPQRFAISFRNKWMVNHSDYIISHITRDFGGAQQFVSLAERQGKTVINITQ